MCKGGAMKCAQAKSCTTLGSAQQLKQEAGSGAVRHDWEGSLKPEPRLQKAGLSLGIAFAMSCWS